MKHITKLLGAIVIFIIPSTLLAQTATYTINGKVGQLSAPAKAYLMYSNAAGRQTDSTAITNGAFSFNGTIDQPGSAYLIVNKKGTGMRSNDAGYIDIYLEAGTISVNSPDSIENAKITGGAINTDNAKLKIALAPVNAKMEALNKDYQAATDEQKSRRILWIILIKEAIHLSRNKKPFI
jgi:outer membrane murein-binding lipoprotein Lpp